MERYDPSERPRFVMPGDVVGSNGKFVHGSYILINGGKLVATRTGILSLRGEKLTLVAMRDIYRPAPGDRVIGRVTDVEPDHWTVDIYSFRTFPLYPGDTPWNVGFDHMLSFLDMGDVIVARVNQSSGHSRLYLSMKGPGVKKLKKGYIAMINISRMPRFVGREMETINRIRRETGCRILVGNNGVIWTEGKPEGVSRVVSIAEMVARTPPTVPLDEKISDILRGGM
jgi:exosome complex component RRP4